MTCDQLLVATAARLEAAGIAHAGCEAEVMLTDRLGISRAALPLYRHQNVPEEFLCAFEPLVTRRLRREPWQYITGSAPFRHLELTVTPAVLIPRPETEILVDLALRALPHGGTLADIGTGSGAIALAVAQERPDVRVAAVEYSAAALAVARGNLARYGLPNVTFHAGDLTAPLAGQRFDVVAANLPYISAAEFAGLEPEVKAFEPQMALTAPEAGLALIRRLIATAPEVLNPGGMLLLELGMTQGDAVRADLTAAGYDAAALHCDLTGRTRFASGRHPGR